MPVEKKIVENKYNEDKNIIIIDGKEYKSIQKEVTIPWQYLNDLHPDEISKIETESKNISVMFPTVENIIEYKKLQKYISSKAVVFSEINKVAVTQNSELSNWKASIPQKRISLDVAREEKDKYMRKAFANHNEKMIILIATKKNCPYCIKQIPILDMLTRDYAVKFKEVDIDENQAFALKYEVQKTPDMFLLYDNEGSPEMARVGTGLHALDELVEGIGIALYTLKKESVDIIK